MPGAEPKGQLRQALKAGKCPNAFGGWRPSNPAGTQDGYGARSHGGQRPSLGAWSTCQAAPANFKVHGEGEGLVLYKGLILCQVTLPQLSPKGEATRLLYVSELLLGRTAPQAGSGQPRPILPVVHPDPGSWPGRRLPSRHR